MRNKIIQYIKLLLEICSCILHDINLNIHFQNFCPIFIYEFLYHDKKINVHVRSPFGNIFFLHFRQCARRNA